MSKLKLILNSINNLIKNNFEIVQVDSTMTILNHTLPSSAFELCLDEFWAAVSEYRLEADAV